MLLGLFILSRLFKRTIALLRAIGASSRSVFAVVWTFGAVMLVTGSNLGLISGIGFAAVISIIVTTRTDIYVSASLGWTEIHFITGFVSIALLPAVIALKSDIVSSLRY